MIALLSPRRLLPHARRFATGGTASIVAGALANNGLRIVSSMTLTRLLTAEAFGVVGIILSVTLALALLSDIGTYPFVMRHKDGTDPVFLDEVWTLRLIRGVGITAVAVMLATPVAHLIGKPQLAPVLMVYSSIYLLESLSSLAFVSAVREGRLWRLTMLDLITSVMQLIVSIGFALLFHSYWALVIATLGGMGLKSALSYLIFPGTKRRFTLNLQRAGEVWRFSRFIALSSMLSIVILQSDKLVLARLMPLGPYGLYAIATTLAVAPVSLGHSYATRILFPAYAEAFRQSPARLAEIFYAKRRTTTLLFMFAAGGLIGGAGLLVRILYDPRYAAVTPYLQLLAISTTVAISIGSSEEALVACGKVRYTLWGNISRVTWLAAGGVLSIVTGSVMALVAMVGTVELAALGTFWFGLRREGVLRLREEALGFAASAAGAGVGYGLTLAATMLVPAHIA